jgi:N4-gp56 family major capsid protein
VQEYAQTIAVQPGEIGAYRNIRFIATTNAKIFADSGGAASTTFRYTTANTALDVYSTLILGRDAYGIVPIMTGNSRIIIHKAGGNSDPLNQRNTVGWKAGGASVILNDAWMLRIEHAVSV